MTANEPEEKNGATPLAEPAKPKKAKVLIVDDHPTMREGLMRVIERAADLQVCGDTDSAPRRCS